LLKLNGGSDEVLRILILHDAIDAIGSAFGVLVIKVCEVLSVLLKLKLGFYTVFPLLSGNFKPLVG